MKAAETNRRKHGPDFYERIGTKGGKLGTTGGFASSHELAREAGRKGGMASKRGRFEKTVNYKGKMVTLTELEEMFGVRYGTLRARINKLGWSVEKAVETPLGNQGKRNKQGTE